MNMQIRFNRFLAILCLVICFGLQPVSVVFAFSPSTLFNGSKGEEVRELQQALIDLGYLKGTADGVFGNNTENAVRKFQKSNKLTVDGLAGVSTRNLIISKAQAKKKQAPSVTETSASSSGASSASSPVSSSSGKSSSSSSGSSETSSLFGTYAAIRSGDRGNRVRTLQQALVTLGFLGGKPDGVFGSKTKSAVKSFQRSNKLTADGIAGKRTLSAIQSALSAGPSSDTAVQSVQASAAASPASQVLSAEKNEGDLNPKIAAPSGVQLLHWFNDVKPSLSGGQHLLVYDPSSGLSWTLRILSRGRHCDAEPVTAKDTRTMVAAFGGVNTWNQKAVFVRLPDGRWSLASTHDMPHDSGSVKNNNFNGHLCVHFLRDMDEAQKNDPKYGVANQNTIRAKWKQMTGEEIP